jgi:hypothetical protein
LLNVRSKKWCSVKQGIPKQDGGKIEGYYIMNLSHPTYRVDVRGKDVYRILLRKLLGK